MKREILEALLNNEDAPGDADGKRMILMMKFGAQYMGTVRRGPLPEVFIIKTVGEVPDPAAPEDPRRRKMSAFDIYFDVEDVATVTQPAAQTRIVGASVFDLDKLRQP